MSEASDWQKGGIRYAKLKEVVPSYLAPDRVEAFFVGVRGSGRARLRSPFTPFQREFVIAATSSGAKVLKLRLPGVFRASVKATVFAGDPGSVSWDGRRMSVGDVSYSPISYHEEDAAKVARLLAADN